MTDDTPHADVFPSKTLRPTYYRVSITTQAVMAAEKLEVTFRDQTHNNHFGDAMTMHLNRTAAVALAFALLRDALKLPHNAK